MTFPAVDNQPSAMWDQLFNRSPIGIAIVGLDGKWLKVNPRLCDMLGYTEYELLKRDFQSVTVNEDVDPDIETLRRVERGELDGYTMKKRYLTKEGTVIWISLTVNGYKEEDGKVLFYFSHIQPLSNEQKHIQELLDTQNKMLVAHLNESLETLKMMSDMHKKAVDIAAEERRRKQDNHLTGWLGFLDRHAQWIVPAIVTAIIGIILFWKNTAILEERLRYLENPPPGRKQSYINMKEDYERIILG